MSLRLVNLACEELRNLTQVRIDPHPRFNVVEGENGQGKTNLLEAIYMLAAVKTFRQANNRELVRWGQASARIRGVVERRGLERTIELEITSRGKRLQLDGNPVVRTADLAGEMNVVFFGPDDMALTKGGPAGRRQFLDRAIFNVWPTYLNEARSYASALKNRNSLIRQQRADSVPSSVFASFDQEFCRWGARLLRRRAMFVDSFGPLFVSALEDMTAGELSGQLRYTSTIELDSCDELAIQANLRSALAASSKADLARGFTTVGPHTDDLVVTLDGRPARRFASQGQHRTIVLALKMAELRRIEQELGVFPLLLLDDVSSELDRSRNAHLLSFLDDAGGQVFITTTDRRWIQLTGPSRVFSVRAGTVNIVADT